MAGKKYQGKDLYTNFWAGLLNGIGSLWNNITGAGTTHAQDEANAFTAQQAEINREFQHAEAQEQMAFQERMANSQYQRGVADMQAAGINPAIAYAQGGAVAPAGAAGAGSAGASVSASQGASLSELLQMLTLPKQIAKLEAETAAAYAVADRDTATAEKTRVEASWIDATTLSQLHVNDSVIAKNGAAIEEILASAEGKRIDNTYKPEMLDQQLSRGYVDIELAMVGINKELQEIERLKADTASGWKLAELRERQKELVAAQVGLVKAQEWQATQAGNESVVRIGNVEAATKGISLDNWRKEYENAFTELTGSKPDTPLLNAITTKAQLHGISYEKRKAKVNQNRSARR